MARRRGERGGGGTRRGFPPDPAPRGPGPRPPRRPDSERARPAVPGSRALRADAPPLPGLPAIRGELLYGLHSVREALRARRRKLHRLFVVQPGPPGEGATASQGSEIARLGREAGVPVEPIGRDAVRGLLGSAAERAQGVLLDAGNPPEVPLEVLCGGARGRRLLVALDGVEDPQNVGAIARVADAAGAGGLVLPGRRSAPLSPAVSRASAGAIEWIPASRVGNLSQALGILKQEGFWTLGADAEAAADLFALPARVVEGDLVLVLGAEGRGIRPGIERHLDHRARIPMAGRVASLNVSAAAAVVLFELVRRRGAPG